MSKKIIIAGGRTFDNYDAMYRFMDAIINNEYTPIIVSGTANGADKLGERYANAKGYDIIRMPADWDKYGKSAGYKRNEQMALVADMAVIFWDKQSKGTKHMIDLANKHNLEVKIFYY